MNTQNILKKPNKVFTKILIKEINNYIKYNQPEFGKLPSSVQDIAINGFISGYVTKEKEIQDSKK